MLLSPLDALAKCKNGAILLDIRPEVLALFKGFDVENVIWCDRKRISGYLEDFPHNKELIVADSTGIYSREFCSRLVEKGYGSVYQLAGGFVEWEKGKLPMRMNTKAKLTGSCMCQLKFRKSKN